MLFNGELSDLSHLSGLSDLPDLIWSTWSLWSIWSVRCVLSIWSVRCVQSTQACTRQARERAHTETPAVKVTSQRETIRWSHLHVQNSENNQGTNERARAGTPLKRWHFSQEPREITRIVARNELLAGQLRATAPSVLVCQHHRVLYPLGTAAHAIEQTMYTVVRSSTPTWSHDDLDHSG